MKNYKDLLELSDDELIMAEHNELGIWYFTSIYKFSKAVNEPITLIRYHIDKHGNFRGWTFDIVDGCDVIYKFINPEKI